MKLQEVDVNIFLETKIRNGRPAERPLSLQIQLWHIEHCTLGCEIIEVRMDRCVEQLSTALTKPRRWLMILVYSESRFSLNLIENYNSQRAIKTAKKT